MEGAVLRIGVIGPGKVGTVLALALHEAGYAVVAVAGRRLASAEALSRRIPGCVAFDRPQTVVDGADLVFLTTPDDAIAEVAAAVSWRPGQAAVHTSGALSLDVLAAAGRDGASAGSIHPLQTFAGADEGRALLAGSAFAIEGSPALLPLLRELVEALGGQPVELPPGAKTLYHVAAVLMSNYTVTLAKLVTDLWESFGVDRETALAALLPLLHGAVRNLETLGLPDALTGPVSRGDAGTVRRHMEALSLEAPELLGVYRQLGLATIPVALAKGSLSPGMAAELERVLQPGDVTGAFSTRDTGPTFSPWEATSVPEHGR